MEKDICGYLYLKSYLWIHPIMISFVCELALSSGALFRRFPSRPINRMKGVLRKAVIPLWGEVIQVSSIDEISLELDWKGLIRFLTTRED